MQEIGLAIREGATAFIVREYKVLSVFVLVVDPTKIFKNCKSVGFMRGRSRLFRNWGSRHRGNMGTDLLGPFLRPQEAPGD